MTAISKLLLFLALTTSIALTSTSVSAETIKIGWIGPLTGNAAALGVDSATAAQMVFEKLNKSGGINGKQIKLIIEDDQYITAKTVSAYNKLVHQQGVKILFVVTYGGLFAIAEKAQRDGVLLLDPLDCDDAIAALPKNTICVAKKTEDIGYDNSSYAVTNKQDPVGIIYFDGDPFMGTLARASIKKLEELGSEVALSEGYTDDLSDFKPILLKAKARGVRSLFFYGYDNIGTALSQARELGIDAQFYSTITIASPGFMSAAGDSANGTIVTSWLAPRSDRFLTFMEEFKRREKRAPFLEISTIPSIDIANLLIDALRASSNKELSMSEIRDYLYATKNYAGVSGTITIDPDGITRSFENKIYVFNGGELNLVN